MRHIHDDQGTGWRVSVGRESYGVLLLLFDRVAGDEVRKLLIEASTRAEAQSLLQDYTEADLRAMLASSHPYEADSGLAF